jgi:hypothetical protein
MAEKFEKLLDKATDSLNPVNLKGQSFGFNWLGNVLIACGYPVSYKRDETWGPQIVLGDKKHPAPAYRYRGEITDFSRDDNIVTVGLWTAWEPMPGVLATALHTIGVKYTDGVFDGISVAWESEEPGFQYYGGSDSEFCDADISICGEIPVELYNNNKELRDIFKSSDFDDEVVYVDQRDYADNLAYELNRYLGAEKASLDEALKALMEKYPNITISYSKYQFEDWLLGEFDPKTDVLNQ